MNDAELAKTLTEINTALEELPKDFNKLTKEERKQRVMLLTRKNILLKIQTARAKGNASEETKNMALYTMFCMWGHKNPFLVNFFMNKIRSDFM